MTEPEPFDTTFEYSFAADYGPTGRGVGAHHDRFRLVLEISPAPDHRPLVADPQPARAFASWAECTFGDLGPVFGPDAELVRPARLLDEVIDGPFDLTGLARWVWEAWHERLPALSSVAAVTVEREVADWPQGASPYAARFTADFRHRVFLQRVAIGGALLDDQGRCESPLGDLLRSAGWAAYNIGNGRTVHHDTDGAGSWQAAMAEVSDGEQRDTALVELRSWLAACTEFGQAVADAGPEDDPAARQAVWEARERARAAARPWLDTLAEPLETERRVAAFHGRLPRDAWLHHPLAYREFPQGPEWHVPLEQLLTPLAR